MPKIELLNIDCMTYMATLSDKAFDLAIVDPPYGIDINMNMGRKKGKKAMHDKKEWDKETPEDVYFEQVMRVSKNQIIWGGNYFDLPITKSWIFWDKCVPEGVDFADGELAWTSFDKTLVKCTVKYTGFQGMDDGGKIHPTQKPVRLYKWLLKKYAEPGQSILDTHIGSGSIALACHDFDFDLTGCEIDKDYYDAAVKRLKNHQSQLQLF